MVHFQLIFVPDLWALYLEYCSIGNNGVIGSVCGFLIYYGVYILLGSLNTGEKMRDIIVLVELKRINTTGRNDWIRPTRKK